MSAVNVAARRDAANKEAVARMVGASPVLVDIQPAGAVVPGMTATTVLTSGPRLPWSAYTGRQRHAVLSAAVYEGLAADLDEADKRLSDGRITVAATHDHGCVGSVAGVYTASMPVFVVEDPASGRRGFCNLYEGESRKRLNYGAFDDEVAAGLDFLRDELAPVLADGVRRLGGVPLVPLIARALRMGDELHSRNTAATTLFLKELTPALLDLAADGGRERAMSISCREFGIRVSGTGDTWFRGALPDVDCQLFDGFTDDDIEWIGGESHITETMYDITVAEHPHYKVPVLGFRGTPVGIDVFKVLETGIQPVIDGGLAGRGGGQIGAGTLRPRLDCFAAAAAAYEERYGR